MVPKKKQRLRVFLSSTSVDLGEERDKVLEAIRYVRLEHEAMEYFGADARQPIDVCLENVRESDVYVGIIGHRYGTIVEEIGKSYTHMEYDEAIRIGLPCLIYMRSDNVPILPASMERNPESMVKLDDFKTLLRGRHTVTDFADSGNLAMKVTADLSALAHGVTYRERFKRSTASLRTRLINVIDSTLAETGEQKAFLEDTIGYIKTYHRRQVLSKPSLFLSYTHSDKDFARKIATDLLSHGIIVWMDEGEIKPGDSLVETIGSAINNMDFFAVLLSQDSVKSDWVKRELSVAIYRELNTRRIKIIPILIADCDIPPLLRDRLYVDMRHEEGYESAIRNLLDVLKRIEG